MVPVGGRFATKVMGIINASPESFYKGSVRTGAREIAAAARQMQEHGAHIIDIGAMSTAPYLETVIPVDEEIRRMKQAIRAVKGACHLPVSADTPRAAVADGVLLFAQRDDYVYVLSMDICAANASIPSRQLRKHARTYRVCRPVRHQSSVCWHPA